MAIDPPTNDALVRADQAALDQGGDDTAAGTLAVAEAGSAVARVVQARFACFIGVIHGIDASLSG